MNNSKKGFVLAEAIIVSVFIVGLFTYIAVNIFPLITRYKLASNYNNPNEIYLSNVLYDELLMSKQNKKYKLYVGLHKFTKNDDSTISCTYVNSEHDQYSPCEEDETFSSNYFKSLIYDYLDARYILVVYKDNGISQNVRDNISKEFRQYYIYQEPKFDTNNTTILLEFENGKYAYVTRDF